MAESHGCERCWPPDPAAAWKARQARAEHTVLLDDSHERIRILQCRACAQHFVSVFREFVDWADGDDPQYWKLTPLTPAEAGLLSAADHAMVIPVLNRLTADRRCLYGAFPKGEPGSVRWSVGGWIQV